MGVYFYGTIDSFDGMSLTILINYFLTITKILKIKETSGLQIRKVVKVSETLRIKILIGDKVMEIAGVTILEKLSDLI